MPKPITTRQQYWLEHIQAAGLSNQTLVDYARSHELCVRYLYHWKAKLIRLGHLSGKSFSSFVRVSSGIASGDSQNGRCTVIFPNGIRLELQGLSSALIPVLFHQARRQS